jgi:hypothetical protein
MSSLPSAHEGGGKSERGWTCTLQPQQAEPKKYTIITEYTQKVAHPQTRCTH